MRISNAEQERGKSIDRNGTNEGTEVRFLYEGIYRRARGYDAPMNEGDYWLITRNEENTGDRLFIFPTVLLNMALPIHIHKSEDNPLTTK